MTGELLSRRECLKVLRDIGAFIFLGPILTKSNPVTLTEPPLSGADLLSRLGYQLTPIAETDIWQAMNSHGDMLANSSVRPKPDGTWPRSKDNEEGSYEGDWGLGWDVPGWDPQIENEENWALSIDFNGHPRSDMNNPDRNFPDQQRRASITFGGNEFPEIEVAFAKSDTRSAVMWDGRIMAWVPKEKDIMHNYLILKKDGKVRLFLDNQELIEPVDVVVSGGPRKGIFGGQNWSGCEDPTGAKTSADCWYGGWANFHGNVAAFKAE